MIDFVVFEANKTEACEDFRATRKVYKNLFDKGEVHGFEKKLLIDIPSKSIRVSFRMADLDKCAGIRPTIVYFTRNVPDMFIRDYIKCRAHDELILRNEAELAEWITKCERKSE